MDALHNLWQQQYIEQLKSEVLSRMRDACFPYALIKSMHTSIATDTDCVTQTTDVTYKMYDTPEEMMRDYCHGDIIVIDPRIQNTKQYK